MNVIIIETHNEDGVEWGISLTDHNPTPENYIGCKDYESANNLKNLLAKLIPCVDYQGILNAVSEGTQIGILLGSRTGQ